MCEAKRVMDLATDTVCFTYALRFITQVIPSVVILAVRTEKIKELLERLQSKAYSLPESIDDECNKLMASIDYNGALASVEIAEGDLDEDALIEDFLQDALYDDGAVPDVD